MEQKAENAIRRLEHLIKTHKIGKGDDYIIAYTVAIDIIKDEFREE